MHDLWTRAAQRSRHALLHGALEPFATEEHAVEDGGVVFSVRRVSTLETKRASSTRRSGNPFLEPDPHLLVEDAWPPAHRVLLNKFPVIADHLLIVTRAFVPQAAILDVGDFHALLDALIATDGLGFYNAGPDAGASQPHRHLQVVRLPLGAAGGRFPTEQALLGGRAPFPCAVADLPPDAERARDVYVALLERLGRPAAWNLLATRDHLVVVPRTREGVDGISVNALGFAGSLFAGNEAELDAIRRIGPCALLRRVTGGET